MLSLIQRIHLEDRISSGNIIAYSGLCSVQLSPMEDRFQYCLNAKYNENLTIQIASGGG